MSCNVELTEEETLCLHQYFERVDETEDLSFLYPAEYMAFQRIAGQVCKASTEMLRSNYNKLIELARQSIACSAPGHGIALRGAPRAISGSPLSSAPAQTRKLRRTPAAFGSAPAVPLAEPAIQAILRQCLNAFEAGDLERANALFAPGARAVSPFHGYQTAREFLSRVVATSGGARLTFHDVRTNVEGRPQALGYFLYEGPRSDTSDAPADDAEVFHFVLNMDEPGESIQSMIVL